MIKWTISATHYFTKKKKRKQKKLPNCQKKVDGDLPYL